MSYQKRRSMLVVIDSFIILFAFLVSHLFLNVNGSLVELPKLLIGASCLILLHHLFSFKFGMYRKAWEHASLSELVDLLKTVTYTVCGSFVILFSLQGIVFYRSYIVTWMIYFIFLSGSRLTWRLINESNYHVTPTKKNTLIVGAGVGGTILARQLLTEKNCDLLPVAFIDESEKKERLEIFNIPVAGKMKDIEQIIKKKYIQHIVIAIPSLTARELSNIYQTCLQTGVKTQIVPSLDDIVHGNVSMTQLRDVSVEELLGRDPVQLDEKGIFESLSEKVILVTGAGGSIGSELCRQVIKYKPQKLILLGHGENSIYTIEMELLEHKLAGEINIITEIADIQDRKRIFEVVEKHKPQVIYHAAAHKHVPLMEKNPNEAVKNNVIGTKNMAEAADCFGVNTFVLISSDKAVNPTSVMGATKRMAEMVVQSLDKMSKTKFVSVRFGNVLGSRGSVLPLFKKQIEKGGPITITHPDMERYFMTIPEASRLVIQASTLANGGEIFVLDMGEPVKIKDLAENLIRLSGYDVEEIGIKYSGIRPGEKLFEELLGSDEVHDEQIYPKIYRGKSAIQPSEFNLWYIELMNKLQECSDNELKQYLLSSVNSKPIIKMTS
ncbi:nucleoside-diphosphate sugar epimerase/dehydratase [Bacillus sp. JJ664]